MDVRPSRSVATMPAYAGSRVTVMGLGRFGGGVGAVRFLARHGARITLTDLKSPTELSEPLHDIRDVPLETARLGEHLESDFTSADLVVASPAVRPDHPCLTAARARGVPVTTEIGLLWRHCRGRIIGVTGSAGKSTTAALTHHLLTAAGRRAWLGGNIGGSLLDVVNDISPADWVVLELSSFQLQYLDADGVSPEIAVVTNFAPNHLDWHRSLEEYRAAKQVILRRQRTSDVAVLNADDLDVRAWTTAGRRIEFGESAGAGGVRLRPPRQLELALAGTSPLPVALPAGFPPGEHNLRNAAAALAAVAATGADVSSGATGLASFRGLPHRLEFVGARQGRAFYDDSKSTTPEAAVMALRAFDRPLVLLAGGSDKGADLSPLAGEIARRVKSVALMGATAERLDRLIAAAAPDGAGPVRHVAADFANAFAWAVAQSLAGDIILLSPGCASFGWFRDYADRGEQFQQAVERLTE